MTETQNTWQVGTDALRIEVRGKFDGKDAADYIPTPESEKLCVDLASYGGPLDLLLHLIKKHSMDIFDIPIVEITQKYLAVIKEMQELNLDIAGEFILMAATLTEIKSRMLLPPEEVENSEEEDAGVDPRAELVRKLLEYQKFKNAAELLKSRGCLGADVFFRQQDSEIFVNSDMMDSILDEPAPLAAVEVFELIGLFAKAIEKATPKIAHSVSFEKVSIRARMNELVDFSRLKPQFDFLDAIRFFRVQSKLDIIVTFLALLEMARLKLIKIEQNSSETLNIIANSENLWASEDEIFSELNEDKLPN